MSSGEGGPTASRPAEGRLIGRHRGTEAGPTIVVVGGIHGNEPSGVRAARRVIDRLARENRPFHGELVALAGNLGALARNTRYLKVDLNRQWTPERVAALRRHPAAADAPPEEGEQRQLLAELDDAVARARGPLFFIDLHTSSAAGPPFLTIGDTLRHRAFALQFPLPVILGLEEQVDGALLEYMNNLGHITLGVEAGRHDAPESVDYHESLLWMALAATGLMDRGDIAEFERHHRLLDEARSGIPHLIEVRFRRAIRPEDQFRMEPGYSNLQRVNSGSLLAHDRQGEIRTSEDGLILLPLYQGQGNDGYFWCREVRRFWLRLSAILRRLRFGAIMHLLPGVRRDPDHPENLIVDTHVARFYPLELFHLMGFRKRRQVGTTLVVSRRCFDLGDAHLRDAQPGRS